MKNIRKFSLVIPVFNESKNITILAAEINSVMKTIDCEWECIWVDDGSKDDSWNMISALAQPHIGLCLKQNSGQSAALMAGINSSKFDLIITLDSDLQNDPADIPLLIAEFGDEIDVVTGYRLDRQDYMFRKKVPSLMANSIARKLTGVKLRDLGCTLRLFRKQLIIENPMLGEMHRVVMLHFALSGARIIEVPTNHRPRIHGNSNYGLERIFKFLGDVFLAKVLKIIFNKPLYFFGSISLFTVATSIFLILFAIILRITNIKSYIDSSLIIGALVLFSTASLVLSIGLITEILIRLVKPKYVDEKFYKHTTLHKKAN